jgi:hypothetical protein
MHNSHTTASRKHHQSVAWLRRTIMRELELDQMVLRYCRQVIMLIMNRVHSRMREQNLQSLRRKIENPHSRTNPNTRSAFLRRIQTPCSGKTGTGAVEEELNGNA